MKKIEFDIKGDYSPDCLSQYIDDIRHSDVIIMPLEWQFNIYACFYRDAAEILEKKIMYLSEVSVEEAIEQVMGLSLADLNSKSRKQKLVFARMIYSYYYRNKGESYLSIEAQLNHDYTTIIYLVKKFKDNYIYCKEFRKLCNKIEEIMKIKLI